MSKKVTPTPFTGGPLRGTYCFIHKAKPTKRVDEAGNVVSLFSSAFLLPKNDVNTPNILAQLNAAVEAAKQVGARELWGGTIPPGLKLPIRDGDSPMDKKSADKEYNGHWFFNTTAGKKPGILGINGMPILSEDDAQSGYWYIVDLNFYPFRNDGNDGVAVGLNNLLVQRKDTVLGGGGQAPEQAFAAFINKTAGGQGNSGGGFGGSSGGQSSGFGGGGFGGGNPGGFL